VARDQRIRLDVLEYPRYPAPDVADTEGHRRGHLTLYTTEHLVKVPRLYLGIDLDGAETGERVVVRHRCGERSVRHRACEPGVEVIRSAHARVTRHGPGGRAVPQL